MGDGVGDGVCVGVGVGVGVGEGVGVGSCVGVGEGEGICAYPRGEPKAQPTMRNIVHLSFALAGVTIVIV